MSWQKTAVIGVKLSCIQFVPGIHGIVQMILSMAACDFLKVSYVTPVPGLLPQHNSWKNVYPRSYQIKVV